MSTARRTALDSPRLTASQRERLTAAGRRRDKEAEKAARTFERNTARHVAQRDRTLAVADEEYDAAVATIMAELAPKPGGRS